MITKSKQNWSVGSTVKVGFLQLTVLAAKATPGDYAPDAYLLQRGDSYFRFVPHNGLSRLEDFEVAEDFPEWVAMQEAA